MKRCRLLILIVLVAVVVRNLSAGPDTSSDLISKDKLLAIAAETRNFSKIGHESPQGINVQGALDSDRQFSNVVTNRRTFPSHRELMQYQSQRPWLWRYDVRFSCN